MVKIRLTRRGRKRLALYDVVVADARAPRDGRFIEKIGTYNPNVNPAQVDIDTEKAFEWVMKGAQPTDTVKAMLSYKGVMMRKHLQIGVIKGALTQEEADKRMADWIQQKEEKITQKRDKLSADLEASKKARLEAETKIKEARAEALKSKNIVEEESPAPEAAAEETEETPAEEPKAEAKEEPKAEEAKEEPKAEEAKEEPKAEAKKEEEPKAEAKKEEPKKEEPKAEAKEEEKPKEEAKEEKPKAEAKEESSEEEKKKD